MHGLAPALIAALATSACGGGQAATTRLVQTQERAGISHALAVCVADTVERQLGDNITRQLAANLDKLPPSLEVSLTKIAATCALSTVTVTTRPAATVPPAGPTKAPRPGS